jgi:hypothetical protein
MITDLRTLQLDGIDMLVSLHSSAGSDLVQVHDPRNHRLISSAGPYGVNFLAVCELGWREPVIAISTDCGVVWLDPRTGAEIHPADTAARVFPMASWAGTLLGGSWLAPFPVLRWDGGTGLRLEPLGFHEALPAALSVLDLPDGPVVCTGDESGMVSRWDPRTGARAGETLTVGDERITAITSVRLADGRHLIAATTADLHRWDAATGEPVGVPIVVDSYAVRRMDPVIVNDRPELITLGSDEVVQRWDAETGEQIGDPIPGFSVTVLRRYGELTLAVGTAQGTLDMRPLGQPHPGRRT